MLVGLRWFSWFVCIAFWDLGGWWILLGWLLTLRFLFSVSGDFDCGGFEVVGSLRGGGVVVVCGLGEFRFLGLLRCVVVV